MVGRVLTAASSFFLEFEGIVHQRLPGFAAFDIYGDEFADLFVASDEFVDPGNDFGGCCVGADRNGALANLLTEPKRIV
jgi:hypothetical protein